MTKVNLDALLPREDFDTDENQNSAKKKDSFSISDLREDDFFYASLRKPDFQRETNEWTSAKIVELIKSFIEGELIPAVILWRSKSGYNFVIDGSHRISSLIAWINDDYGDGKITKEMFDGLVPEEQIKIAERTRRKVNKEIGKYSDFQLALRKPENVKPEIVKKARNLSAIAVQLQWVEGDAEVAESSFFKINQQAAKIDATELKLIKSRKKPNGISARGIIKSGKGHQYWAKFTKEKKEEIERLSKEINEIFFLPKLKNPIKTLDLPIGGKGYSSQSPLLIFEFVNIANKVEKLDDVAIDSDGSKTIEYLKNCKKLVNRINSTHPSSLGLHPAVYFYSKGGRHKSASFFGVALFLIQLEKRKKFKAFTDIREKFEDALIKYDFVLQQILRHYRGASKAIPHFKEFYSILMDKLKTNDIDTAIKEIEKSKKFKFIKLSDGRQNTESESEDFSREAKSAIFMTEALKNAVRCKICNARIHRNAISIDHIERKQDGGLGTFDNGQLTHPYCNSRYKN